MLGRVQPEMFRQALVEGDCRWTLSRQWERHGTRILTWVMLNPSVADASRDDPTLRMIIGLSKSWGYDGLYVVNMFPFRSSSPAELDKWVRAGGVTPELKIRNHAFIMECIGFSGGNVVAAWGAALPRNFDPASTLRTLEITSRYTRQSINWQHIGLTMGGHPKHPLARGKYRIKPDTQLQPFEWKEVYA